MLNYTRNLNFECVILSHLCGYGCRYCWGMKLARFINMDVNINDRLVIDCDLVALKNYADFRENCAIVSSSDTDVLKTDSVKSRQPFHFRASRNITFHSNHVVYVPSSRNLEGLCRRNIEITIWCYVYILVRLRIG